MAEDTKFIVTEINKLLSRNYNLISFSALGSDDLLQVLSDVLSEIEQKENGKIDIRTENPEQSSIRIFSLLRVLKYQPDTDPVLFRQGLVKGETETIYPILKWILSNVNIARQRAYLSRFLVKVEIPTEYLSDPDIGSIYEKYLNMVEEFKTLHKDRETGRKGGETAAELKADVEAMEKEKKTLIGRIERMKIRIEPAKHLLDAAQHLRRERDRERELVLQKSQEAEAYEAVEMALQRAEKELEILKDEGAGLTPQTVLQRLTEEVSVLTVIANERLPEEIKNKKLQLEALTAVVDSPYIGTDEIAALRTKLDAAAREVQELVEKKASEMGSDKMAPFRQQAAAIGNIKKNVLDKLEKSESTLTELEAKLKEKKEKAKLVSEETAPDGEEFKRYVARLKTKSTLYKQSKAELSALKAENGVLRRTIEILENQLSEIQTNDEAELMTLPENFTKETANEINKKLAEEIAKLQKELAPLLDEVKPLRKKAQELEEKYEKAVKNHDSVQASMDESTSELAQEVESLKASIKETVEKNNELNKEMDRMKYLEERLEQDKKNYANKSGEPTLRDELQESIQAEEKKMKLLKEDEKHLAEQASQNEYQVQQWKNISSILEAKVKCAEELKKRDGIVVREKGAETLILQ
ncbi:intraflagellar transport protein 81 homolog [Leptopilina boulardi]|uniref:intraflagellar transport protein 81 homolog n=1 Tax=Leptopilina boulardi TaxID=63433 RepID=UPI0021F62A5C|nr:intraflagellar transport protein 81 homolog [Leptopilina boulardi]